MATTKKTPTSKKTTSKPKARPVTWKFYVVTVGIFIVAVTSVIVFALFASHSFASQQTNARYDRIKDIYSSINLDDSYRIESKNVFGDKRPYEVGEGRTYSSEIRYIKAATVKDTVAELDSKIKAAGFTFTEEAYQGSVAPQYYYKSDKGEYVRLQVSSKLYDDAVQNTLLMTNEFSKDLEKIDTNAGPSNISLKVNLDDNNE
jgi:hypothetical protein